MQKAPFSLATKLFMDRCDLETSRNLCLTMGWPLEMAYQFHHFTWITFQKYRIKYNRGEWDYLRASCAEISKITQDDQNFIKFLLKNGSVKKYFSLNQLFCLSCYFGIAELVSKLLKNSSVDPSHLQNYCIKKASGRGHDQVVKLLVKDSRVDPSARGNYAIKWASKFGRFATVRLLLADSRVDPSAGDNFPIKWAYRNGHDHVVKLLSQDSRVDVKARFRLVE